MAVRLNREGREIWFERLLWSWVPCHWKGWAMIGGFVAAMLACTSVLEWISSAMGKPDAVWPSLVIVPLLALSWWLAERHSPSNVR